MWATKFGGKVYLYNHFAPVHAKAQSFGFIFDGRTPAAVAEPVNPKLLPILRKDGYELMYYCEKCSDWVPRTYAADRDDFLVPQDVPPSRYICEGCLRG